MAKSKKRKPSLRQRLRTDAEKKLELLITNVRKEASAVVHETSVDPALLMQLAAQPERSKSLRNALVTVIANDTERKLEKLYNDQMDMLASGDEASGD